MERLRSAMLAVLAGLAIHAVLAQPAHAEDKPPLREALALQEAIQDAIARAEPSIACIAVSRSTAYREITAAMNLPVTADVPGKLGEWSPRKFVPPAGFDPQRAEALARLESTLDLSDASHVPEFFGSGVVIDTDGLILTNWHVVRDATRIYVRLPGKAGSYADIHAADARSDLAVLKLIRKPNGLKAVTFGDADRVRKGQFVIALSNPFAVGFADGSPSASWGVISNIRRRAPGQLGPRTETSPEPKPLQQHSTLLQTDARLNLGSSGGALVDLRGDVVGLTTSLAALHGGDTAGGYAVPMSAAIRRVVEVLRRGEEMEYGFLGVGFSVEMVNPPDGVRITDALTGGPAQRAGLIKDDVLQAVNGVPIRDADDLSLNIGTLPAGTEVTLRVRTGRAEPREVRATLGKLNHKLPVIASRRPEPVFGIRVAWAEGSKDEGVVVSEVQPGSPAARRGITTTDRIVAVNGERPANPQQFYRLAREASIELTLAEGNRKVKLP